MKKNKIFGIILITAIFIILLASNRVLAATETKYYMDSVYNVYTLSIDWESIDWDTVGISGNIPGKLTCEVYSTGATISYVFESLENPGANIDVYQKARLVYIKRK